MSIVTIPKLNFKFVFRVKYQTKSANKKKRSENISKEKVTPYLQRHLEEDNCLFPHLNPSPKKLKYLQVCTANSKRKYIRNHMHPQADNLQKAKLIIQIGNHLNSNNYVIHETLKHENKSLTID